MTEANQKSHEIIRVLLADDHPATRVGIRAMLEEARDIEIVGEVEDGAAAKTLAEALRPRILLLDLRMPGPRPSEVARWVRRHCPETITLVVTAHDVDAYLADMAAAGAAGFVTKDQACPRLVEAIRRAAYGETLYTREQLERARRWREEAGRKWEQMTDRQREVLRLLAQGRSNAAIAEALGVMPKTVEYHVSNLLDKLEVDSRLEAVTWAIEHLPDSLYKETS